MNTKQVTDTTAKGLIESIQENCDILASFYNPQVNINFSKIQIDYEALKLIENHTKKLMLDAEKQK